MPIPFSRLGSRLSKCQSLFRDWDRDSKMEGDHCDRDSQEDPALISVAYHAARLLQLVTKSKSCSEFDKSDNFNFVQIIHQSFNRRFYRKWQCKNLLEYVSTLRKTCFLFLCLSPLSACFSSEWVTSEQYCRNSCGWRMPIFKGKYLKDEYLVSK